MVIKVLIAHRAGKEPVTLAASAIVFLGPFRGVFVWFSAREMLRFDCEGPPPMPVPGLAIDHPCEQRLGTTAVARRLVPYRRPTAPDFANPPRSAREIRKIPALPLSKRMIGRSAATRVRQRRVHRRERRRRRACACVSATRRRARGGVRGGHAERAHSNGLPNSQNLNEIVRRALSIEGQSRPDSAFPLGPYSPPHDENAANRHLPLMRSIVVIAAVALAVGVLAPRYLSNVGPAPAPAAPQAPPPASATVAAADGARDRS